MIINSRQYFNTLIFNCDNGRISQKTYMLTYISIGIVTCFMNACKYPYRRAFVCKRTWKGGEGVVHLKLTISNEF